jgi:FkbM family methyltransferase
MSFVSYAQNYEDVILWRALRDVEQGFYVDVGAADPVVDSVTCAFYERGWSGINVEPLEEHFEKLMQARIRDTNLRVAMGSEPGLRTLHAVAGTGLSTLDAEIGERCSSGGFNVQKILVPVLTLGKILEECAPPIIHFLKIDVEGSEGEVLKGLSLKDFRPWILIVEANEPNSTTSTRFKWEHLVTGCGYGFAYFDGLNCFYVADEIPGLKERIAVPPNVFDDFERYTEWSSRQAADTLQKLSELKLSEALDLHNALQAEQAQSVSLHNALQVEQAQSASLRNARQAEQAQSASLRNAWQAEQVQNVGLRNALQAEQARANFLLGRIHQFETQLAAPSVDRFVGRTLARLREIGDRLTGGGLRRLMERLATLLRRTVSRFTRHQRLPVSGRAVTTPSAGALAGGVSPGARSNEIKEQDLESFSSLFDFATFEIGSALYSFDLTTLNARSVKIIESDGRHQVLDLVPDQTQRVEVPLPAGKVWNMIRFEAGGVPQDDDHTLFFSVNLDTTEATIRIPSETLKPVCGFSGIEADGKACHVWAIAELAELDVLNVPEETDQALYSFDITTLDARSIKITPADGRQQTLKFLPGQSQRVKVCLTGKRQGNKVRFETGPEGVTPPGDERTMFFKVDLHTVLTRIAVPRQTLKRAGGFIEIKDEKNTSHLWAIARQADLKVLDILCYNRAVALPPSARPIYLRLHSTVFDSALWTRAR